MFNDIEDESSLVTVHLPTDEDGLLGRECPNTECHPRYFKVRPKDKTDDVNPHITTTEPITEQVDNLSEPTSFQDTDYLYCPYCGRYGVQDEFATEAQKEYAISVILRQLTEEFQQHLQTLARPSDPHAFISIGIEVKLGALPEIASYQEESLRQNVVCPHCAASYAVYGLSFYCPYCGRGTILWHLEQNAQEIEKVLTIPNRLIDLLEPQGYQRLIENALEDVVSLWEGYLKAIYRYSIRQRFTPQQVEQLERTINTTFQRIDGAVERYQRDLNIDLLAPLEPDQVDFLREQFQRRHILTHNLGLADERFQSRSIQNIRVGQEISVDAQDTLHSLHTVMQVLRALSK
jgi:hypothetical protein